MIQQMSFGELEQRDGIWILPIFGRLDSGPDDIQARQKIEEIKSVDCSKLVADIGGVDSIGSSGLSFLVELYRLVAKRPGGGCFVITSPSKRVRDVIEATRLITILTLTDDLDSALTHCAQTGAAAKQAGGFR